MTVIQLTNITFIRSDRIILDRISWTIGRGQHWALLGANGSGKTSLLKIIAGYEWPSDGSVHVLGRHFGDCYLPELRKTIGWVSAAVEHRLPEEDTALEIAASGFDASLGLYRPLRRDETEQTRSALAALGIEGLADQPYQVLSQGEKQRVLIARALVNRPALLILDEPCAGLDPVSRERFLDDLGRLAETPESPTILLVTHHVEEIRPWIDNLLVLKEGRVLAAGSTAATLTAANMGDAFGHPCRIGNTHGRYRLDLNPRD